MAAHGSSSIQVRHSKSKDFTLSDPVNDLSRGVIGTGVNTK